MRIYLKNKPGAIRKVVAWALIPLLAACGNGTDSSPNATNTSGSGVNLAATTTAVDVVTPASYTVVNMGVGFYITLKDNRVLNERGQVAGGKPLPGSEITHAFRIDNGVSKDLGALESVNNFSFATALNAGGLVTGVSRFGNASHAFLHDGTTMKDLGALESVDNSSYAIAINAGGLVTGYSNIRNTNHAFLHDGTIMKDLGALESVDNYSYATAINASGLVTGYSQFRDTYHAFLHDGTTMIDLGALGGAAARSEARAINARGQVVGKSVTTDNVEHAFIKSPGGSQMIDLNTRLTNAPGIELFDAVAISNSGYILAEANTGWVLLKPAAAVP